MKKQESVSRYMVGELECDAEQMLKMYAEQKIDFSTLICPVGQDVFHRFDEDKEFKPFLLKLYRQRSYSLSRWRVLLCYLPFPFIFSFIVVLGLDWSGLRAFYILYTFYLMLGVVGTPLTTSSKDNPNFWLLMIPYLNSIFGWRLFQKMSKNLPEKQQKKITIFNFSFWFLMVLFLVSNTLLPLSNWCGITQFIIMILLLTSSCLLTLTFRYDTPQKYKEFLLNNPKPKVKFRLVAEPMPKWHKNPSGLKMFKQFLVGVGVILLSLVVYLLPFYAVGEYRYYRGIESIPYHIVNQEITGFETDIPKISDQAFDYLYEKIEGEIAPNVQQELQQVMPMLDKFRKELRLMETPNRNVLNLASLSEKQRDNVYNYTYYRRLEQRITSVSKKEAITEELFRDFENMELSQLQTTTLICNRRRSQLLAQNLKTLPVERLQKELEFWQNEDKNDIYEYLYRGIIKDNFFFFQMFESLSNMLYTLPFRNWLKANMLEASIKRSELCKQDYFQIKEVLKKQKGLESFLHYTSPLYEADFIAQLIATARMSINAIELELYRREHGLYPENPQLLIDPFSGNPLIYIPNQMLYSIDKDGNDDKGRQRSSNDSDTTDIVFLLNQ